MALQKYDETLDFQGDEEPLPEGYTEALRDCAALAANLLNQAINGETINRCWDCSSWAGRCIQGKNQPDSPQRSMRTIFAKTIENGDNDV